jgi:DNA primase
MQSASPGKATIGLDRDEAGRAATAHAVERAAGAASSPAVYVVDPDELAPAKDPDEFVRDRAQDWPAVVENRTCGVVWRAREFARDIDSASPVAARRRALASAGVWLGSLPPRWSLEQEDAVRAVAEQCGYSPEAAARAFAARFWSPERSRRLSHECARGM